MNKLFLRIFIEVQNKSEALEVVDFVEQRLKTVCDLSISRIEKYWKISDYYEISFDIDIGSNTLDLVMSLIATNWKKCGNTYIWNEEEKNNSFISSKIKWASLEYID